MRKKLAFALFFMILGLLLTQPDRISDAVQKGLTLFFEGVFPALFPGLILCRYALPRLEFPKGGKFAALFEAVTRCPGSLLGVWCTARCSGSPAGAAAFGTSLAGQEIPPERMSYYALVFSGVSPVFITVTAAACLADIPNAGWILLASHELGLIASYRLLGRGLALQTLQPAIRSAPPTLAQVVSSSLVTLGQVACLILIFSIGWELIKLCPWLSLLPPAIQILLQGILEMSRGVAGAGTLPAAQALALSAFCIGFSGLCIAMQCFSALQVPLNRGRYLAYKALHGILCAAIALGCYALFGSVSLPAAAFKVDPGNVGTWEILSAELTVLGYAIWGKLRTIDPASGRRYWSPH